MRFRNTMATLSTKWKRTDKTSNNLLVYGSLIHFPLLTFYQGYNCNCVPNCPLEKGLALTVVFWVAQLVGRQLKRFIIQHQGPPVLSLHDWLACWKPTRKTKITAATLQGFRASKFQQSTSLFACTSNSRKSHTHGPCAGQQSVTAASTEDPDDAEGKSLILQQDTFDRK